MPVYNHHCDSEKCSPDFPKYDAIMGDLTWRIITDVWFLIQRFYFSAVLRVQQLCVKTFNKALLPFEPVFEQVRKVPPKDISCQGILFQCLRLQFLIVLFLYPLLVQAVKVIAVKPFANLGKPGRQEGCAFSDDNLGN